MDNGDEFFARHFRRRAASNRVAMLGAAGDEDDLEAGRRFLALLAPDGWAVPSWPTEYGGRGATAEEAAAIARALARYETPDLYPFLVGLALIGPTVMTHGTPEQCTRWLPPIREGHEIWSQLFSEPDAGSDLAGLATRAEADGDQWRVTGAKTWTSRAHYAERGLLLARTDIDVPKHAGITAFALPMRQHGVEVRPLRQLNGDDHFSQVLLDEAVVDDTDRIGDVGDGWRVALTTLDHERAAGGGGGGLEAGQLIEHLHEHHAASDPIARQRAAAVLTDMEAARRTAARARDTGDPRAATGGKIRMADAVKAAAALGLDVQGPAGVTGEGDDDWLTVFLTAPSISIRGGTDEIQRNVIGERVLGLPPEPRIDKQIPYRDIRRTHSR
ncbi:MAG: acyl-CoA dehydrogenase family protein [Acidimicrobiales bacterium]|nr:acyl-CoA dehydrogenase family protein [Acidimicrobiales bacterium]